MPPLSHPHAQFVPIAPDLHIHELVESTTNFDYVTRLPKEILKQHSPQSLEQLILLHVVIGGKPLVIEGWEDHIDPYLFSPEWLQANMNKTEQKVRDIPAGIDIPMTLGHYLRSMEQLTNQFTTANYRNPKRQRLYLKDIDTPEEWAKELKALVPETFYYLNECIESRTGGDGAILEPNEYGQMKYGKGVAPAGDLMSSLPEEMRAQNMMCYIGHEGTYTPAHREMCASLGHNIMVETSQDGNGSRSGSSLWFMTETKEREVVSEYFLSMLGHDIEVEKHFAQINAWKKAPFNVWVVEQRVGDLILIPPLAPHQVWNRGTRTMKAAWNRTTVDTLELALHEALPRARLVCRDEQYKNKAIIYYTLQKYHDLLQRDTIEPKMWKYGRIKQLLEDFKRLFALYTEVLVSEMFAAALPAETDVEMLPYDSNVTCSYCRCNIFNRFLTCRNCIERGTSGVEDTYDICMECYAMGRSCACISNLSWVEQWPWSTLTENYETWRQLLVRCDGFIDSQKSLQPLEVARKRYGRKPVAHVCQEQLKLRPWRDITQPNVEPELSEEEPDVDDEGRVKKKKASTSRRQVKKHKGKTSACHICFHQEWNWKLAFCTTCNNAYCYGVLWRAFDLMPQEVMEDRDWSCPKCLHICSCGKCRRTPSQNPYSPKGTLLGHDTKKVADFRSLESLVDFSKTNLTWLRGENDDNPQESNRMKKLKEKAEAEKAREDVIDESYLDNGDQEAINTDQPPNDNLDADDNMGIDPQLLEFNSSSKASANGAFQTNGNEQEAGDNAYALSGAENAHAHDWLENGNFDVDFDSFLPDTSYSSNPTALVAPMIAEEVLDEVAAPTRMMGIGYYQQGANGADQILYDTPEAESVQGSTSAAVIEPNFALSDILPQKETIKKRKHVIEDTEFFASKKQKKAAETKRIITIFGESDSEELEHPKHAKQRQPHRNITKPQTYTDVGEEAMPFTADDMVPATNRKPRADLDDTELAARAMMKFSNQLGSEKKVRRRRTRAEIVADEAETAGPAPAKKERKSIWLARKEAEERGAVYQPEETRKRRRHTTGLDGASAIEFSGSDAENTRNVEIDDDDSLFGNDPEAPADPDAGSESDPFEDKPILENRQSKAPSSGKRRGRPPKNRVATEIVDILDSSGSDRFYDDEGRETSTPINDTKGSAQAKRKPGRPPRSSLPTSKVHAVLDTPKRGRGRPKKSLSLSGPTESLRSTGPSLMLSLKDRVHLNGKPFRITAGNPRPSIRTEHELSASPTVVIDGATDANMPLASPDMSDSTFMVESPVQKPQDEVRLVSPDVNEEQSPEPIVNSNSPLSRQSEDDDVSDLDHDTQPAHKNGATIIRKASMSSLGYETTPEPSAGPTVIRKGDMVPTTKNGATVIRKDDLDYPTLSKTGPTIITGRLGNNLPASKGPTVVRLVTSDEEEEQQEEEDESSQYSSSSDSEPESPPKQPVMNRRMPVGRGNMARRGRGRPPLMNR